MHSNSIWIWLTALRVFLSIHDDGFQGPDQTLEVRLRAWFREFEMTFPRQNNESLWNNRQPTDDAHFNERFRPLLDLTEDARNNLNEFLRRLRELKDYQKGGEAKNNIILRVDRMLQLACKNEEFKTEMLALITEALETCRDRVLIIFNDIEIRWQVHQEGLSKQDIKELCIRAQRYEEVKKNVLELAGYRHLGDQIETILYFLVQLRDKLNLPISTQGMAYQEVGAQGISEEDLEMVQARILSYSDQNLLARSDIWQAYIQQQYRKNVAELDAKYGAILQKAEDYFNSDPASRTQFLEHPDNRELAEILRTLDAANYSYVQAANAISKTRSDEISRLGLK